ncbi:hypothetical protein WB334_26670, partial [Escherichia coli]|uniref:hypothetical protein n=1 Tax=Escherichia coli TaxID=562 RepID=UPI00215892F9
PVVQPVDDAAPVDDVADRDELAVAEGEIEAVAASDADRPAPATNRPMADESVADESVADEFVDPIADVQAGPVEFTELNLVAATAVIGRKIKLDDLTAIEGIGSAIAELCGGIGIHTWADLAATEVSL